jgi:hypothetical protein
MRKEKYPEPDPDPYLQQMDPDPVDLKTCGFCGSGSPTLTLKKFSDCIFNRKFHLRLLPGAELCSLPLLLVGAVLLQEEKGAASGLCNREDNCARCTIPL